MKIKELISKIPTPVWIVAVLLLGIFIYWKADDIGSWMERRRQAIFDENQAKYEQQIDQIRKERDQERVLRQLAEDRAKKSEVDEQLKSQEADALRKLIEDQGGRIAQKENELTEILKRYQNDQAYIEAAKNGQVSKHDLCLKQCQDSASIGYPCRPNYCDQIKGR